MANLEGMPISALPELTGDLQDEDEIVVYRPSTGKAYQANTDLIDSSYILPSYTFSTSRDVGEQVDELLEGQTRRVLFAYVGASSNTGMPTSGANYYIMVYKNTNAIATMFTIAQGVTNFYIKIRNTGNGWNNTWYRVTGEAAS